MLAVAASNLLAAGGAQAFARRVLGVYNSAEGKTEIDNPLRNGIESVLHHLGLQLEYHDLATGLPDSAATARTRGTIIWLESDHLADPAGYWRWVSGQIEGGRRLVLLNAMGPRFDLAGEAVPLSLINDALAPLGLTVGDNYSSMPLDIELLHKDPSMVEFERRLDYELTRFTEVRATGPDTESLLRLRLRSSGAVTDAVAIGLWGGYALEGYVLYRDPESGRIQWRIDPFRFLEAALGIVGSPRPDPTTLFGSRVLYSHIDGDGLRNRSLIDRQRAAGEVVFEDILKRYDELPFTVSFVTAEVDPAVLGSSAVLDLARQMLTLPNVEAASHSYSHPLIWNQAYTTVEGVSEYTEEIEGAVFNGPALLPWDLPGYVYDPVFETVGSCRFIEERILPTGRRCRVLLWSGNCLPGPEELQALDSHGLLNMNGGDSRFDAEYPSYYYVAPLYRQVGAHFQVHSSNSNENTYTNLWTGPFGGYQNVIHTFENTGSPRRVLPVNVYFHFYSGEREAAVRALHRVYEWVEAERENLLPVFASQYIEAVGGFIDCRIDSVGPDAWEFREYGACRTVRFDGVDKVPDLERSRGVLGYRQQGGVLYVHLADGADARVELTGLAPAKPFLAWSTALLQDVTVEDDQTLHFTRSGLGAAVVVWDNLPPSRDFLVHTDSGSDIGSARSDATGRLRFDLPATAPTRVRAELVGAGG